MPWTGAYQEPETIKMSRAAALLGRRSTAGNLPAAWLPTCVRDGARNRLLLFGSAESGQGRDSLMGHIQPTRVETAFVTQEKFAAGFCGTPENGTIDLSRMKQWHYPLRRETLVGWYRGRTRDPKRTLSARESASACIACVIGHAASSCPLAVA